MDATATPHIGTLNEGSLHAALKDRYARPGDEFEVALDGFVIDIRRGDQLIEIQTGSFGAMANKLDSLLDRYSVTIVHPIARHTWLVRPGTRERKSPKRGALVHVFEELVSVPTLIDHPGLTLEVVLVDVAKQQTHDPTLRRRRGGFRTIDRQLREVIETHRFEAASDLRRFIPDGLPTPFTTGDLAELGGYPRPSAQQIAYCLRALGIFVEVGRGRSGYQYVLDRAS